MTDYARIVVPGTPISKSNFKMMNKDGRFFLPSNSGKYHDRYANYEDAIALTARSQNPGVVFTESLIAILKVFYKSAKRHPDTNNITKSIFDGVEKSGILINDAQVRRLIIEEHYDRENPRFELELYRESAFTMDFSVLRRTERVPPVEYAPPSNGMRAVPRKSPPGAGDVPGGNPSTAKGDTCALCGAVLVPGAFLKADGGTTFLCRDCFTKHL